jgi:hypothetical protein
MEHARRASLRRRERRPQRAPRSATTFNPDHQNAQLKFLGDYFGFLFDGTKLRFAWSDPRNGSDSQVFYAGGAP